MAQKRDYAKNPPTKLTELNRNSMLEYVVGLGNEDDLDWFVDLFDNNKVEKEITADTTNHKKGEKVDVYDMKTIRKAYAEKYFPKLLDNKPKKKPVSDFEKKLANLRKQLNK